MPHGREVQPAFRRRWRAWRINTSGRWRALVVVNEVRDAPPGFVAANVRNRRDRRIPFLHRNSRTIHSRGKSTVAHRIHPSQHVRHLFRKKPPSLFLVQKYYRFRGEAFAPRRFDRGFCISHPKHSRVRFGLQFALQTPVEQNQKSKTIFEEARTSPAPIIPFCARRDVEPVACKRKRGMQPGQSRITRIIIHIKSKIAACFSLGLKPS